jgi:hypothetical protein
VGNNNGSGPNLGGILSMGDTYRTGIGFKSVGAHAK